MQFYAQQLHISAKHLNYVCVQNSGTTASALIQRFTTERIMILLQNKHLNIAEIAAEMEFSSRSFFTRYVKKQLGMTPTEYRNRLDWFTSAGLTEQRAFDFVDALNIWVQ